MKLAQLFSIFPQLHWGEAADRDVAGITQDSREVKSGFIFVAIRGSRGDGHEHLSKAAQQGAVALVVEDETSVPRDFKGSYVKVPSTRRALDRLAQKYYGDPAQKLFCVGVTGTNGKTTITYMVEAIFKQFGWLTGVMGTIDHHVGAQKWESSLTTPDPLTLQRRLTEFLAAGAHAAAFEVSSHALDQHRVDTLPFAVGVFTNFTRDHLDYHQSMENYFSAKERLFTDLLGRHSQINTAILNADDPWIQKVRVKDGVAVWWYGQGVDAPADFSFRPLKADLSGTLFHLSTPRGNVEIHLPCPGLHNVYNAVAAAAVGLAAGVALETVQVALSEFRGAPGRLERVMNNRGVHIFVDYAHTDDALSTVLRSIHNIQKEGQIITVFGCGGDRDRGKRPLMARAAAEFSDIVVLTSDNPRTEDPEQILRDVSAGLPKNWSGRSVVEVDRRSALKQALQMAGEGDVILVAGKGHEDYQILGTQKVPFSDQVILKELLAKESYGPVER